MKSIITMCSIYTTSTSEIRVTNPDGTTVTFQEPYNKDNTFYGLLTKLRTLAYAYIAAFAESHPYEVIATAKHENDVTIVEPVKTDGI